MDKNNLPGEKREGFLRVQEKIESIHDDKIGS
jgi:hypothetical protein